MPDLFRFIWATEDAIGTQFDTFPTSGSFHWSMVACRWARYCSCISRHGHEPLWFQWRLNQQLVTESSMYGPQSSPTLGQESWLAEQLACGQSWGRQWARMQHFKMFFVYLTLPPLQPHAPANENGWSKRSKIMSKSLNLFKCTFYLSLEPFVVFFSLHRCSCFFSCVAVALITQLLLRLERLRHCLM